MRHFSFVLGLGAAAVSLLGLILFLSTASKAAASSNFDVIQINFSNASTEPPGSYLRDHGEAYGVRNGTYQGGGVYSYGWVEPDSSTPFNLNGNGIKRSGPADVRLASFMQMERFPPEAGDWEIALPNGMYSVTVATGDSLSFGAEHWLSIENQAGVVKFVANETRKFMTVTRVVWVNDGRLSLRQTWGDNTKINYVDIISTTAYLERPSVVASTPGHAQTEVSLTPTVSVTLAVPNGALDGATVTTETVRLTRLVDGAVITAVVNIVGDDTIILQPTSPLDINVTYLFEMSEAVRDISGAAIIPYQMFFTTASGLDPNNGPVAFQKTIEFSSSNTNLTAVTIGPDGKLYVGSLTGNIFRFTINPNGTLSGQQTISTVRDNNGGSRAILGMAFDPAATADNLILWISNNPAALSNAPDWSSKISRLTGANLESIEDVVIRLPRSYLDHMTNGLAFGPDGALYFMQGSNTTMGAPDSTWNFRPERLLSAAVLRLDTTAVMTPPLDVKTEEDGTYDPFAPDAPLTIYASGTRNSYDLVWHSNGSLYVPTNASAPGGSTPGTPATLPEACQTRRLDLAANGPYTMPQVITMTNVVQVQREYLFRVEQGGYYGHPNPERCEWVLNGGNPTADLDTAEVSLYPVGTEPDRNWRGAAFDFGNNHSPDGVIEYLSDSFGGYLQGKLIVARYSRSDDLAVLAPNTTNGDILSIETQIPGFTDLTNAVDIVENPINGHLYVVGVSPGRVWLLRPIEVDVSIEKSVHVTTAVPLQNITYTLTISNAGPMAATNVVVTDTMPVGLAATYIPPQCNGELVCTIPSLAVGERVTLTLGAQVVMTTAGTLTNTAAVTVDEFDRELGNQVSSAVIQVPEQGYDLQLAKVGEAAVLLNEPIHYTLTVTNAGPLAASGVVVTDTVPDNVLLVGASPTCTVGAAVVCGGGTLEVGQTAVFTLTVVPTVTGIVTNTAVAAGDGVDLVADDNGAMAVTAVDVLAADLILYKSASETELLLGSPLTYTLVVTNAGPSLATGVVVTDTLPTGVVVEGMSNNCTLSSVVVCDVGNVAVEGTAVLTITVTPTAAGVLTNTAEARGNEFDGDAANNEAQAVVEAMPLADVMIEKSASADVVVIGRLLTYTLTITNNGPSEATELVVTDMLPLAVQFVGATAGCGGDAVVVCEIDELGVGETAVLTLRVIPTADGSITNVAEVSAAEQDDTLGNNQSQVTTLVLLEMMAVELSGPENGLTGQGVSFTAVVTPITVTQPITYIWQATGQEPVMHTNGLSDTVTFTWTLPGEQTVTVTVVNQWGEVTAVYTIIIESRLYMPVVLRVD